MKNIWLVPVKLESSSWETEGGCAEMWLDANGSEASVSGSREMKGTRVGGWVGLLEEWERES
jgi:hypothetical protein